MKNKLPSTEKIIPYIIFLIGILYGLGFAIDWNVSFKAQLETEKSAWDIVAAIGSFLGGIGTIGLLALGWVKSKDWLTQIKENQRLDLAINSLQKLHPFAGEASTEIYSFFSKQDILIDIENKHISELDDNLTLNQLESIEELASDFGISKDRLMLLTFEIHKLKTIAEKHYSLINIDNLEKKVADLSSSITIPIWYKEITTIKEYKNYKVIIQDKASNLVVCVRKYEEEWMEKLLSSHSSK